MSKQFALLRNATRINEYLSRERYYLGKMRENANVSSSLFDSKVRQFNELVASMNDLYRLASDVSENVFDPYDPEASEADVVVQTSYVPDVTYDAPLIEAVVVAPEPVAPVTHEVEADEPEPEPEPLDTPASAELDVEESKQRAAGALDEYTNTAVQDIADYDPEEHLSPSVLPQRGEPEVETDLDESTSYMTHMDGVRINADPTQITEVRTAVEQDGEAAKKGVDLPVDDLFTKAKKDVGELVNFDEEMAEVAARRSRLTD